jgi:hypothetical protein
MPHAWVNNPRDQDRRCSRHKSALVLILLGVSAIYTWKNSKGEEMETQPARRPISKGICTFCKSELAKNKMTQHLKSCKQRLAGIAAEEEKSQETNTRLFQILAEGCYNPQYWLHFEVPASETLWSLDNFLKAMWIDDLDHLSSFTINGTDYRAAYPDEIFSFSKGFEDEDVGCNEKEKNGKIIDEIVSRYLPEQVAGPTGLIHIDFSAWVSELKKPRSTDDLVDYLKEELSRIQKEEKRALNSDGEISEEEFSTIYLTAYSQKMVVKSLLEKIEDRSMDVLLGRVLKVGQKFSYVYDFGSSTYINLRVIAERDGIVQNKKKPVQLLAQNTLSTFVCTVCGKPATQIAMECFHGGMEDSVYCDACAEKEIEDGQALPIINSPRVGVL